MIYKLFIPMNIMNIMNRGDRGKILIFLYFCFWYRVYAHESTM